MYNDKIVLITWLVVGVIANAISIPITAASCHPERVISRIKFTGVLVVLIILAAMLPTEAKAAEIQEAQETITIQNELNTDGFELPIDGATGYAVAAANIRAENSSKSNKLGVIPAGGMFVIHEDCGQYMHVTYQDITGYAVKSLVMINLPDVIPSIDYIDSNAVSSLFKSSGYDIQNVTGKQLYTGKTWNARLNKDEFNMPVLYTMAKKLAAAQKQALADGNCIMLYEGYRPVAVQKLVNTELSKLMNTNQTVRKNINDGTWGKSWFIAKSLSNHQMGFAVDVSLGRITAKQDFKSEKYKLEIPTEVKHLDMPTEMHELSNKAVSLAYPVNSLSKTAWKNVGYAKSMTNDAKLLRTYFTENGMSPLPSEWWHFNDLDARTAVKNTAQCYGAFEITGNVSQALK